MSDRRLVIFDWNGTLQDDLSHIYRCGVQRIFRHFGLPCPSLDEYRDAVTADFMQFYWNRGIPQTVTDRDLDAIMAEGFVEGRDGGPPLFPDTVATIDALYGRGYEFRIASGWEQKLLRAAIQRHGLDQYPYMQLAIGGVRDKRAAFADHITQTGVRPESVAVVGDTVEDAVAAASLGARPFLVTRGFHSRERIETACVQLPTLHIVSTLRDLLTYL